MRLCSDTSKLVISPSPSLLVWSHTDLEDADWVVTLKLFIFSVQVLYCSCVFGLHDIVLFSDSLGFCLLDKSHIGYINAHFPLPLPLLLLIFFLVVGLHLLLLEAFLHRVVVSLHVKYFSYAVGKLWLTLGDLCAE